MKSAATKIYYLPIDGGRFEAAPTAQAEEQPCWQERLMEWIGGLVLCVVIGCVLSLVFVQIAKWIWF